jgi:hypothetical protein
MCVCGYEGSCYCYTDEARGFKNAFVCHGCVADNINKFWPESSNLAQYIRRFDERTPEQKEKAHEIQKLNSERGRDSAAIPRETSSLATI